MNVQTLPQPTLNRRAANLPFWLLLAVAVAFSVEPRQPLLRVGSLIEFSLVEVLLLALLGVWAGMAFRARRIPTYPRRLVVPIALFLSSQLLATVFAPDQQLAALKFCYRLTLGIMTGWAAYDLLTTHARWETLLKAVALGGAVVGIVGVAEATTGVGSAFADAFRRGVVTAGDLERVSSTLTYPTITAVVLELTIPLLVLWASGVKVRWQQILLSAMILFSLSTLVLTLSRAGIGLLGVTLLIMAGAAWGRAEKRRALFIGGTAVVLGLLTVFLLYINPTARLRLVSETESAWYRATYQVAPLPELRPGARVRVPVTVTNTSPRTWETDSTQPFLLSYHLYDEDGTLVTYDGARTLLDNPVAPNDSVTVNAYLFAPTEPGEYQVAWDMLQEQVSWFSWKENDPYTTTLTVEGTAAADTEELNITERPQAVVRIPTPTRLELWRVAWGMVLTRPLLGVGPDTFRLRYGYALGYDQFDDHIHSNNQFIEFLVGSGVVGLLAFTAFSVSLAGALWQQVKGASATTWLLHFTLALLMGVWYVHGMVDSFWEFTPTFTLFWLLVALALANGGGRGGRVVSTAERGT